MKNIIKLSLVAVLCTCSMAEEDKGLRERGHSVKEVVGNVLKNEPKKVSSTDKFRHMFTDGTVTGQVELMYSAHNINNNPNPYATAVGGHLLYELAEYDGFNAGAEFSIAHNINTLTGDNTKENTTISSVDGSYTELTQAYINYNIEDLNVRVGRQLIDTPLADSDYIRIIDNTFEAAIIEYKLNEFSLVAGYLDRWQGTDAGLDVDNPWQDTGEDGTYFGSISFSNDLLDISAWYYDISKAQTSNTATGNVANKSAYFDISLHNQLTQDFFLHSNAQYLHQSSQDASAIEASIYGFMFEFVAYESLSFSAAYNKSEKQSRKGSFSGFGGGTLYTNMDSMIIDNITTDRDVEAIVTGVTYSFKNVSFLYAYGNFDGDRDSSGQKEHIVEQNIGIEYTPTDDLIIGAICTIDNDKEDTGSGANFGSAGDFENYRVVVAYKF